MTKTKNDEAYERGVHDGLNGNILTDVANSLGKVLDVDKQDRIYRDGYDWGSNQRDSSKPSDSESSSGSDSSGSNANGGCFLTTACVETKGLRDDCKELTLLRQLRDGYIIGLPEGGRSIAEYYRISPSIVNSIKSCENSQVIFSEIYEDLVVPCVALIEKNQNQMAFELYKSRVLMLKEMYLR